MNRIDRLTAILIQLQTKRWITSIEIAERYEVSQRTVYRDIRSLEEAGIPIGAEAGRGYYLVEGYKLPPVMFSRDEAGAFLIAEKLVNRFADKSVKKHFTSATDKIKAVLPEQEKEAVDTLNSQVAILQSGGRANQDYPNEFISTIQRALVEKRCISLSYHAFHSQEKTKNRIVDPLGLVFYGNAWHLIAYCKMREAMRDFRVDRIEQLFITGDCAMEKKPGDLDKYFEEYWTNSDLIQAKVWFSESVARNVISSRYYFGFVDEVEQDGGRVMTFAINEFTYLAHWLLSFGTGLKVIQPPELANELSRIVSVLSKHYL